jgi:hypothetical protein
LFFVLFFFFLLNLEKYFFIPITEHDGDAGTKRTGKLFIERGTIMSTCGHCSEGHHPTYTQKERQ